MNVDPSGNFVLSILASLAIGTAIGAVCGLVNGLASGEAEDLWKYVLIGAATGLATTLLVESSITGFGFAASSYAIGAGGDLATQLWGVSKISYLASQVMLNGAISAMGMGYSAIIGYYYRDRISNSNEMVLQAG